MFDNIEDEIMDDAEYLTIVNPILDNKELGDTHKCILIKLALSGSV